MAKRVVIDPGHGGTDSGAVGNGIVEKDLTLLISNYMFDRFNELGVPVKMTRTSDETLSSSNRPRRVLDQFGNDRDVIVVSNHINAGGGEGAEIIYALRNSDRLASRILNELEKSGQVIRKYYQRRLPSDTSKDYYYIIRDTANNETVIVEYGFLDNANDANRLKNNYKDYAEAVVRAVTEYAGYDYVPVSGSGYYVVKKGDTLWNIAKNNNISVDKLKEINNLASNSLSIGQVLLVNDNSNNDITDDSNNSLNDYYTVVKGDTLYSIANKYGLSVDELKNYNNLTSNTLNIGQKLLVSKRDNLNMYIVKKGDTLYSIANMYNVSVNDLKSVNNLVSNNLSIGQELIIPVNSNNQNLNLQTYTVKKGDTLYNIAKNYNVSVSELKSINNLSSNILSIGQKLQIPS